MGVARVESDAGVGLHDARVADAVVGGPDADVAAGLLHDDAKDDTGVDAGLGGDLLDGGFDKADLAGAIVERHQGGILRPEGVVVGPGTCVIFGVRMFFFRIGRGVVKQVPQVLPHPRHVSQLKPYYGSGKYGSDKINSLGSGKLEAGPLYGT